MQKSKYKFILVLCPEYGKNVHRELRVRSCFNITHTPPAEPCYFDVQGEADRLVLEANQTTHNQQELR